MLAPPKPKKPCPHSQANSKGGPIKGRAGAALVVELLADPMEPGLARLLGAWHRMNWVSLRENSSPLSTDWRV